MATKSILVGYDGSDHAQAALAWALDEGAHTNTAVLLAYAFEWPIVAAPIAPQLTTWPDAAARRGSEDMIHVAVAEAAKCHPEVTVTGVLLDGPPAVVLTEKSRQASLVVLSNRGHGGFADLLIGSTSIAVCAHAHCPVVVVRGIRPGPESPPARVVVGVDGSPCSLLALRYAYDHAARRHVHLHVIRAWTPPPPEWTPVDYAPAAITAAEQADLTDLLAPLRGEYPDVEVTTEVVGDHPSRALIQPSLDAQLVVVGSRGRGGFRGLLLGSVSQQLLHHSACPVAVIREVPPAPATSADGSADSRSTAGTTGS